MNSTVLYIVNYKSVYVVIVFFPRLWPCYVPFHFLFICLDRIRGSVKNIKNVLIDGPIIYCKLCHRVIGFIVEGNSVVLKDVRLLKYEPLFTDIVGGNRVSYIKISTDVSLKRKYPVDVFDLVDEPEPKRQKSNIIVSNIHVILDSSSELSSYIDSASSYGSANEIETFRASSVLSDYDQSPAGYANLQTSSILSDYDQFRIGYVNYDEEYNSPRCSSPITVSSESSVISISSDEGTILNEGQAGVQNLSPITIIDSSNESLDVVMDGKLFIFPFYF